MQNHSTLHPSRFVAGLLAALLPFVAGPLAVLLCFALPTQAQVKAPKAGSVYKETANYGFQLKTPKKWEITPPGPEDGNLIAAFFPARGKGMRIGGKIAQVGFWVVKFDDTITDEVRAEQMIYKYSKTPADWVDANIIGQSWKVDDKKYPETEFKCGMKGVFGTATKYDGKYAGETVCAFSVEYKLDEHRTLAVIGNGPGGKDFKPWEKTIRAMAKSFKRIELEAIKKGRDAADLVGPRLERYEEVKSKLPPDGGWEVHNSPNYFVVSNCDNKKFIKEIQTGLEAIRKILVADFPLDKAYQGSSDPLDGLPEEARAAYEKMSDEEKEKFLEAMNSRSTTRGDGIDPAIRATMSVVKIFQNRQAYLDYGAPQGSAGYWWAATEELCMYEDKSRGRSSTFDTLFHEAFHQYMFYYCGGLQGVTLHGWFNEGTADYYAGYELKGKKVKPGESKTRRGTIRGMIRDDSYAPTPTFITWYRNEYYGQNPLGISQGENYAHGWSLVNFLKRGAKEKPKGWEKEWSNIIPIYLSTALETGDSEKALEVAWGDVDLDELEASWKGYTL